MSHKCESCERPLYAPGTCSACMVALVMRAKVPDWEIKIGITEDGTRYMAGVGRKEGVPAEEPISLTLSKGWYFFPGDCMKYSGSLEGIVALSEQAAKEAGLDSALQIRRETHKIGDLEHTVETVTPATDLADLQQEIFEWANEHYPERTYHNAMTKLVMEEVPEVLRHPSDPMEWADVFILMIDAAKLQGVDIAKAVREKMAINRRRTWAVDPNTGVMRHVR